MLRCGRQELDRVLVHEGDVQETAQLDTEGEIAGNHSLPDAGEDLGALSDHEPGGLLLRAWADGDRERERGEVRVIAMPQPDTERRHPLAETPHLKLPALSRRQLDRGDSWIDHFYDQPMVDAFWGDGDARAVLIEESHFH